MSFTVNLDEPLEQILKENNLPVGGRKRRGGAEGDAEKAAEKAAAKTTLIGLLKKASEIGYDAAVKGAQAAGYAGAAGLVIYVADASFKPGICDPLMLSLSRSISLIPSVAGYAATCDSAAAAYNSAIATAALAVSPLVMMALKKVASIVIPEDTVDKVSDAIIEAVRDPEAAAQKAVQTRSQAKKSRRGEEAAVVEEPGVSPIIPPMVSKPRKSRGGKKTKKRVSKKRKTTRRAAFSY